MDDACVRPRGPRLPGPSAQLVRVDQRTLLGEFFSEIGCPIDVKDKAGGRDPNKKWFHGSVWHYDFVKGANRKSYGLHANVFQLCLIVYGIDTTTPATPAAGRLRSPDRRMTIRIVQCPMWPSHLWKCRMKRTSPDSFRRISYHIRRPFLLLGALSAMRLSVRMWRKP